MEGTGLRDSKRELKRIEWSIVRRIIIILQSSPRMKKTHLAMKSGLGYDKCMLYLAWMDMLDLIRREKDEEGFQVISLSESGMNLYRTQFTDGAAALLSST
ncbi:MAG: hypothetical protein QXJ74_00040 [Nitrososphaera sp.]|uniref:hypothetical protein n=1 Tax=Nitrososphaera sp. TaxID=1971748 RepID=UPI00185DA3D3|nr:hypothetical protein [Nitrososphaera sp.]NWG36434.1 hypothetical protein [Nitrososphaera sp.]